MHNKSAMQISCPRHLLKVSIYMFVKCLRKHFYRDPDSGSLDFDVLWAAFPVKRLLPLLVVYAQSRRAAKRIQREDFLAVAFCFAKQFFIQVNYVVFSLMLSLFFTLVEHFSRETFNSIWLRGLKNDFKSATLNPPNRANKLFATEIIFAFYWFVIANNRAWSLWQCNA